MGRILMSLSLFLCAISAAHASDITVIIENLGPSDGHFLTPVWVGFHNGTFDIYDNGSPAGAGLERLAEDGDNSVLANEFLGSGAGITESTIASRGPIPPLAPGQRVAMRFNLDGSDLNNRYFSYATMIIPSNDAFVANADPMAHPVFAEDGTFVGADFFILGAQSRDAGTEVNDEIPANTAFFGQAAADTGVEENGVITVHPGLLAPGSGGILDDVRFSGMDISRPDYPIARITIIRTAVTVRVENTGPQNGHFLTPAWIGIHDGGFDTYDLGSPASAALERLAEDGTTDEISADFQASGVEGIDGTIASSGIPPFAPGQSASLTFLLDDSTAAVRYLSYATMIIPSNDAFISNADPMAHPLFDEQGRFVETSFEVLGANSRDAGTEVNDEIPANTAFFGQEAPDTGEIEGGVVAVHPGLIAQGGGGIRDDALFSGIDLANGSYRIARISVTLGEEAPGDALYFAQFGSGDDLSSQILLFNPNRRTSATARILFRDDDGDPLDVTLDGVPVNGETEVEIPANGLSTLNSNSDGPVQAGSVSVIADVQLSGSIVFGGPQGLAGVGSSLASEVGFAVSAQSNDDAGTNSGIAVVNLEDRPVTLSLVLYDAQGAPIARGSLDLQPLGHLALFVTEVEWDAAVDFSDFRGAVRVDSPGVRISATALLLGPGQLASLPVTFR